MQYQRRDTPQSSGDITFSPRRQTSIVPLLQEEARRQKANFAMFGEQMRANGQVAINDARAQATAQSRNDNYMLQQLANFQRHLETIIASLLSDSKSKRNSRRSKRKLMPSGSA